MRITHLMLTALVSAHMVSANPFLRGIGKVAGGATAGVASYAANTALGAYLNNTYVVNDEKLPVDEKTLRKAALEVGCKKQYTDWTINAISPYVNKNNTLTACNIGAGTLLNHAFTGKATRKFSIPFFAGQAAAHAISSDYLRHRNVDGQSQESYITNAIKKYSGSEEQPHVRNWEKSWNNVRNETVTSGILAALLRK